MSKKDKELETETTEPVCNNLALSYVKIKNGEWAVVAIDFDHATGYTKKPVVLETLDSEADAVNRFKVRVAQDLMKRMRDVASGVVR